MTSPIELCAFLDAHGIAFQKVDHPAVFTCAEAERMVPDLPGAETKNLFLKDKKGNRHYLVMVGREKTVDLGALKKALGVSKLGFASADRLNRFLGVTPGAVSVLGLVHDTDHRVEPIVDEALWRASAWCCHPLVNTATLVIPKDGILRFFELTGHTPRVMDVPARDPGP